MTYKQKWIDFLFDPKTITGLVLFAAPLIYILFSWAAVVTRIDFKRLEKIMSHIQDVSDEKISFVANGDIAFRINNNPAGKHYYFLMQPDGNFVVYDGDAGPSSRIVFNAKVVCGSTKCKD